MLHLSLQFPNLNLIENLWDELDNKIRKSTINSKIGVKTSLKEEWNSISSKYLKKITYNMSKRLHKVIKEKGFATKY